MRQYQMQEGRSSQSRFITFFPLLILFSTAFQTHLVQGSWVDPDTPKAGRTTKPLTKGDNREYELVS